MNFGGTGFAFGVKDKGSLKFADKLSGSFGGAIDYLKNLGKEGRDLTDTFADPKGQKGIRDYGGAYDRFNASGQQSARVMDLLKSGLRSIRELLDVERVESWMNAFGGRRLQDARSAIEGLTSANMNLTTGFEAQQQQIGQDARRLGANFGFVGAELASFTRETAGLANSTNRGADAAAAAVSNWRWYGEELRAAGFQSARELLQVGDVTGANIGQLSEQVRELHRVYGMTGDQTSMVLGSFTALGQETGNVGEALGQMQSVMEHIRQTAAQGGVTLNAQQLAENARQVAALGAGLYDFGFAGQNATQVSVALSDSLTQARGEMRGLMYGVREGIAALPEALVPALGDVDETFRLMEQGPETFVSGLAGMLARVREAGGDVNPVLQHLSTRMQEAFGAETSATLTNFFRTATTDQITAMSSFQGSTDQLRTLARQGFSTGRTMQESFDLARDAAVASFRAIGRGEASQVIRSMGSEFRVFNDRVREVVAEGGPLGMLAERLSAAHSIGALAFVPQTLRPIALLMGQLGTELGPVLLGLHQMGFRLTMLLSPLTPLLIVLGLLGMRFIDLVLHGKSMSEAFAQIAGEVGSFFTNLPALVERGVNWLTGAFDRFLSSTSSIDWSALWGTVSDSLIRTMSFLWGKLGPYLSRFGAQLMAWLTGAFNRGAAAIESIDWTTLWPRIFGGVRTAARAAGAILQRVGTAIWSTLTEVVTGNAPSGPNSPFVGAIRRFLGAGVSTLRDAATTLWPAMRDGFGEMVSRAQRELPGIFASLWTRVLAGASGLGDVAGQLATYIVLGLAWVATQIPGIVRTWGPRLLEGAQFLRHAAIDLAASFLGGLLTGIETALVRVFPESASKIHEVFGVLRTGLGMLQSVLHTLVSVLGPLVRDTVSSTVDFVVAAFESTRAFVVGVGTGIYEMVRGVWDIVSNTFETIGTLVGSVFGYMYTQFQATVTLIRSVGSAFVELFTDPSAAVRHLGEAVTTFFSSTFQNVRQFSNTWTTAITGFITRFVAGVSRVRSGFDTFLTGLREGIEGWGAAIYNYLGSLFGNLIGAFVTFFVSLATSWSASWNGLLASAQESWTSITTSVGSFITGVLTFFQGLGTSIGTVWAGIQTSAAATLATIGTTIEGWVTTAVGHVTRFKDQFLGALNGVWDRVVGLFGNSVHDVVGDDLTQTNAISSQWSNTFQQHATTAFDSVTQRQGDVTATAEQFRTALAAGLSDALVGAFTTGYTRILASTGTFTRGMQEAMFRLATAIYQRFSLLWGALADFATVTVAAIEATTLRAASGLARLQSQQAAANLAAASTAGPAGPRRQVQLLGRGVQGQATTTDLFAAMHEPDWYERDYRQRFDAKMDALREAIISTRPSPQAQRNTPAGNTREVAAAAARLANANPLFTGG